MKQPTMQVSLTLVLISIVFSVQSLRAQVGLFVQKDERIAKFQNDILQYLVNEKQFRGTTGAVTLEFYKDKMIVRKRLEIYAENSLNNVLLVKFQVNVDHCDKFGGVLTQSKSYFFYNFQDQQFELLTNELDSKNVKLIKDYCEINGN